MYEICCIMKYYYETRSSKLLSHFPIYLLIILWMNQYNDVGMGKHLLVLFYVNKYSLIDIINKILYLELCFLEIE